MQILSDGNCLYRAVGHQLSIHPQSSTAIDFAAMRRMAADHMRSHADVFLPFLTTDDGDLLSEEGYRRYLADMVDPAQAVWGGEPEAAALAAALKIPITIHTATDPPVVLGTEFGAAATGLHISWHKHYYGLGAHYNSVVPVAKGAAAAAAI